MVGVCLSVCLVTLCEWWSLIEKKTWHMHITQFSVLYWIVFVLHENCGYVGICFLILFWYWMPWINLYRAYCWIMLCRMSCDHQEVCHHQVFPVASPKLDLPGRHTVKQTNIHKAAPTRVAQCQSPSKLLSSPALENLEVKWEDEMKSANKRTFHSSKLWPQRETNSGRLSCLVLSVS